MSHQDEPENITVFLTKHSDDGPGTDSLIINSQRADTSDTNLEKTKMLLGDQSATQESPAENKLKIWVDKFSSSLKNSPTTKSSPISDRVSTTNERTSGTFWRNSSKEISDELWLPHQTAGLGSVQQICLNGCSTTSTQSSILCLKSHRRSPMNSQTNLWKSLLSSSQNTMESGGIRCRKIRIYPTMIQKQKFKRLFGVHRSFYNKAIEEYTKDKKRYSHATMRKLIKIKNEDIDSTIRDTPYMVRDEAVKLFCSNLKTNLTLHKGNTAKFEFSTKKSPQQMFSVGQKGITQKNGEIVMFPRFMGKENSKLVLRNKGRRDIDKIGGANKKTCLILKQGVKYYLIVPFKKGLVTVLGAPKSGSVVALDPGMRNFVTGYSPECTFDTVGSTEILNDLYTKLDAYERIRDDRSVPKRVRMKMKLKVSLLRHKIRNIVNNFHKHLAKYLTDNYSVILLPKFSAKGIARRNKCKYVNRRLYGLGHYKFRQILEMKATETGVHFILCTEEWTSKTCTVCGNINKKLGAKKVYCCDKCGTQIDRDVNGARNILIKYLTEL